MQDIEQVKNKIKLLDYILSDAPQSRTKRIGKSLFLTPCPFCNQGIRSPHFYINEESNSFNSYGCNQNGVQGGTIIDYLMARENLDRKDAVKKLFEITNTPFEEVSPRQSLEKPKQQEQEQNKKEVEAIHKFCKENFSKGQYKTELKEYLETRKISEDAIGKYHLFVSNNLYGYASSNIKYLVIPIIEEGKAISYIGRNINNEDKNKESRYRNARIVSIGIFNKQYLKQRADKERELLFICEGVFDAISIEEQGFKAISLNSTNNIKKLLDAVKENLENAKTYKFVIATDTDQPRTEGTRGTTSRTYKIKYIKHIFRHTI